MSGVLLGLFGDRRLQKGGPFCMTGWSNWAGRGVSVRRLGGNRAGEIRLTRFLRHASVSPAEMARTAAEQTAGRCQGRHVLAIQDTTVVRSQGGGGLYLHATLAVDAEDNAILGLIDGRFLSRSEGKASARRKRPIEAKESHRWLQAADRAAEVCAEAARVTVIADREADIFEAFARCPPGADLLIRAAHDRGLEGGQRLFGQADALGPAACATLDLPARPGRTARTARLAVRFMAACLARPQHGVGVGPNGVTVNVVDVREQDPPPGTEPVHWRLLTTHPVGDAAEALAVADLYRRRWAIEQLFRTLKTQGFDIEGVRIEDEQPRCNLVMAALVAAGAGQQLGHPRGGKPRRDGAVRPGPPPVEPAAPP